MTTQGQIYDALKTALGSTYKVITSYDGTEAVDGTGTIAVAITDLEDLQHTGYQDYRYGVAISAMTIADDDPNRDIIQAISDHIQSVDYDALKPSIEGCVGVVRGNAIFSSDGDSNDFSLSIDLYICNASFTN